MEDYKGITGDYADTNRDGKVDFTEYDSDCYDFEHIYKNGHNSAGFTPQKQSGFKGWLRNMTVTNWIIIILLCLQMPFLIIPAIILFIICICQS